VLIFKPYLWRDIVLNNLVWEVVIDRSSPWDFNIYILSTGWDGQIWHLLFFANDRYPAIERYSIQQLCTELALCQVGNMPPRYPGIFMFAERDRRTKHAGA
jgi:hypothetical protein